MRILVLGAGGPFPHRSLPHPCPCDARPLRHRGGRPRVAPAAGTARSAVHPVASRSLRTGSCSAPATQSPLVPNIRNILAGRHSAFWYFDALSPLPESAIALARLTERTFASYGYQMRPSAPRERSRRTSCLKDWTRCWTSPRQFRQPHTTAISRSLARGSIRGATRS